MFKRAAVVLLIAIMCFSGSTGALADTQWNIETVDAPGNVGQYSSLVVDDMGFPHVSYWDAANEDLKYAHRNATGWAVNIVDSAGLVGAHSSIALGPDGQPRISYEDRLNRLLKFAAKDSAGWSTTIVDSSGYVGLYTSLAVDDAGLAHISYYDYKWSRNALKFASQTDLGWSIELVDTGNGDEVGLYTSLALDSAGNPHISYYDRTHAALKYAYRDATGWLIETVVAGSVGEQQTSIALDATGAPCISYYDSAGEDLKVACRVADGWTVDTVDSAGTVGLYSSLAFDTSGSLQVVYYDNSNADLKYAHRMIPGSWMTEVVDANGRVGGYTSLAVDTDDNAHVSYYDFSNGAMKYATSLPLVLPEPQAVVTPAQLDFGGVVVGQQRLLEVVVANHGDGALILKGVSVTGSGYELAEEPAGGAVIEPGDAMAMTVEFRPPVVGMHDGALSVLTNDPEQGTVTVPLVGEGLVLATVDVKPDTLNVSRDSTSLFTAYIELPEGTEATAIDPATVMLEADGIGEPVAVSLAPNTVGDYDGDGVPDLMVKFPALTAPSFAAGELTVTVYGRYSDGTGFTGADVVRVIDNGTADISAKRLRRSR